MLRARPAHGSGRGAGFGAALAAALGAALLVPAAVGAQTVQHDKSLPIEITADRLDVVQPDRIATFTGNVDAVQGDMVLSADRLRVFYNGDGPTAAPAKGDGKNAAPAKGDGQSAAPAKGDGQSAASGQGDGQSAASAKGDGQNAAPAKGDGQSAAGNGSIRRIEAEGNVFLSSPSQTAQGERGVYDVASDQVTLNGSVVLTQGDDVIRGDRLEVDLTSGHSRVLAAAPPASDGAPAKRVRALFVPRTAPAAGPAGAEAETTPGTPKQRGSAAPAPSTTQ
ncbi:MAG TPA: LptA/OstA family protein [Geminicoccaceae bacterium]|nr:LptA/OstA family protein [Geminicoccaceae bacterium]